MTWDELLVVMKGKVPDTLVLDCEGAFLPIVKSFPSILDTVHTIIMENDYLTIEDYREVARILEERNLVRVFERAPLPCKPNFFEVWQIQKLVGDAVGFDGFVPAIVPVVPETSLEESDGSGAGVCLEEAAHTE